MKIAIASDHAGFDLKCHLLHLLLKAGHDVEDFGTRSAEPVDFIDHVYPAALALSEGRADRAILVDGAGYPSGIVANMLPGVYAAVANDLFSARLSREHSDTNALCIGGKVVGAGVAAEIVETWLKAAFLGGKYAARVEKVRQVAARHRRPLDERARQVLTVQDVRDALTRRESLLLDDKTILTPSVLDLLR